MKKHTHFLAYVIFLTYIYFIKQLKQTEMNYSTVQTTERANEIISDYIKENNLRAGIWDVKSCNCECGETTLIHWMNEENKHLSIGVCDMCGDDDAFLNEVLHVN